MRSGAKLPEQEDGVLLTLLALIPPSPTSWERVQEGATVAGYCSLSRLPERAGARASH